MAQEANKYFHGTKLNFDSFEYSYMDTNRFNTGLDAYGPGFYFASEVQTAEGFAYPEGWIWELNSPSGNFITESTPIRQFSEDIYKSIIKSSSNVFTFYQDMGNDVDPGGDYDYDSPLTDEQYENIGGDSVIDYIYEEIISRSNSAIDFLHNIWSELYKDNSGDWVRNVNKSGIDGYVVNLQGEKYLVLYNSSIANSSIRKKYTYKEPSR